jgi:CelD/BcsL family acetyltransferase involved in cellulose biosynthesis
VQISVVRPDELGPGEVAAWRAMQRNTASLGNPFLCPEFAVAVGRYRPGARVAVLSDGPSVAGFFPFEKRRLGVGVPIGAGLTDCQGLIHAPGVDWDPRELLRGCHVSSWQFDHLVQDQRPFDRYVAAAAPSPVIDLADGFDGYQAKLQVKSPQFCRDVARRARKLGREVGELRFVADSRDRAALRSLMAWKSDQYRRTGRTDRFAQPWIIGLVDDLFATCGSHFSGLFSVLYAADAPVAAHFGLRSGPVLAHWFPAYDTGFSKYSPGLIQHLRMVEDTAAVGIRLIDMGKGAMRYKETLKTGDLFVFEGAVTGRSPLAAVHRARIAPTHWAARTIRAHPRLFKAADQLLKRYGRLRGTGPTTRR